jgi:TPR repeat protein
MFIASRPDGQRYVPALIAIVMLALGAAPIHVSAAASDRGASAMAALDAIPAEDWLKQTSGVLLDRVIAASSKESLDAAATKDPRAQALVGSACLSGSHGYAKSEAEAVKFYRLAANSNPIAQNNLGSLLLTGAANGGTPAPADAAEMFRRAAKLGHPVAQLNLGRLYANGNGVEKDVAKAKEFLALAAAQENPEATYDLFLLEKSEAAEKWKKLEAAAATGDADALNALAEAYAEVDRQAFDFIKTNQLQAASNAIARVPDPKRLRYVELTDEHGMTALHWTVGHRNGAGLRWLLDKRSALELKDNFGRTPLKIALDNKDARAMQMLLDRGADPNAALPGHEGELKGLKETSEIVDFMMVTADPAGAIAYFTSACDSGSANTCYTLARSYLDGKTVAKDDAKAAANFAKACDGGVFAACTNLGYQYRNGLGVSQDKPRAAALYEKSCGSNEAAACLNLGLMRETGDGIPKDPAGAAALHRKACAFGIAQACGRLSVLTMMGNGVPKDDASAVALAQKACAGAYASSCTGLGFRHLFGDGLPKDERAAVAMFEKACSEKDGAGCDGLGALYETGTGVAKDAAKAAALYSKGCQLGYQASCKRQAAKAAPSATPAKATVAAPAAATPTGTACKIVRVQLGVDTVASVERDIKARGGTPLVGGNDLAKYRQLSAMSGDYGDDGPPVMAVNYFFDEGIPAGKLIRVMIVRRADSPADFEKLFASRKGVAAAFAGPLQQTSATEFTAANAHCRLKLLPSPDTLFIREVYELAK